MREFLKASLRTATAIFLALLGLAVAVGVFSWAKDSYDRHQAKLFEEVRDWRFDLKDSIGLEAKARTKVVSGNLLVSVDIDGYPKYLSDPRNANAHLIFEFLDQDGFKVISKSLKLSDFSTIVGKDGEKTGLSHQFEEYIDLERYKRFSRMQVGWNLVTEAATEAPAPKPILDHCAPNLSKAERLKRLAQHGTVRETGTGEYNASGHSVHFFYDGTLLNCR